MNVVVYISLSPAPFSIKVPHKKWRERKDIPLTFSKLGFDDDGVSGDRKYIGSMQHGERRG